MLTVGNTFPTAHGPAVKGGRDVLGGPGTSFTDISNTTDKGKWRTPRRSRP